MSSNPRRQGSAVSCSRAFLSGKHKMPYVILDGLSLPRLDAAVSVRVAMTPSLLALEWLGSSLRWGASPPSRRRRNRSKRSAWSLLGLLLIPGCALVRPTPRPTQAPEEEASHYRFPVVLPTEGQHVLPGVVAAAISYAMEDFLPLGAKPSRDATPTEVCSLQRQSYEIGRASCRERVL